MQINQKKEIIYEIFFKFSVLIFYRKYIRMGIGAIF